MEIIVLFIACSASLYICYLKYYIVQFKMDHEFEFLKENYNTSTFFSSLNALVAVSSSREPGIVLFRMFCNKFKSVLFWSVEVI